MTEEKSSAAEKAEQQEDEVEQAKEEVRQLEDDPPEDLEDWPSGKAKYETFGGAEGEHGYHEGPEEKLGPSSLRHTEDGGIEIEGKKVDDPEEHKGKPIPGGPTDPNTPNLRMDKAKPEDASNAPDDAGEESSGDEERDSDEQRSGDE
jgi:hypothetical protein